MTELREEVITTVLLHPAPTPSPARKPPPPPQPSRSHAADAGPPAPASSTAAALTVTAQPHQLQRLTTEEIAARLHSRGTGSRNVQPGWADTFSCQFLESVAKLLQLSCLSLPRPLSSLYPSLISPLSLSVNHRLWKQARGMGNAESSLVGVYGGPHAAEVDFSAFWGTRTFSEAIKIIEIRDETAGPRQNVCSARPGWIRLQFNPIWRRG